HVAHRSSRSMPTLAKTDTRAQIADRQHASYFPPHRMQMRRGGNEVLSHTPASSIYPARSVPDTGAQSGDSGFEQHLAAIERGRAAARELEDARYRGELREERIDVGAGTGELDRARALALIEQERARMPPHACGYERRTAGGHADLHDEQFAFEMVAAREVGDLDDVDELAGLLDDLVDDDVVAGRHERQARHRRIVRGRDRQRIDVVAARGEHAGHTRERTDFVLQQHGNDAAHVKTSPMLPPAAS